MKKIIVSTLLVLCGISYSSNFVALVSPKTSKYEHETPTPPTPPKVEKNLIMTVGSNVKSWGDHRGYNYTTPLGSLTPNLQDGYRIRALSTWVDKPSYGTHNSVLEVDNDHTSTGNREIKAFEVEWVGYQKIVYKNTNSYNDNSGDPNNPGWTTFKPDNNHNITTGLNNWLASQDGKSINVIVKEIDLNQ